MAETTADEREVEALLAIILAASPGTPTLTCRRIAEAIHASPLLDRVRREEGERIAQAIEAQVHAFGQTDPGDPLRAGLIEGYRDSARIARAASVGRGEGLL